VLHQLPDAVRVSRVVAHAPGAVTPASASRTDGPCRRTFISAFKLIQNPFNLSHRFPSDSSSAALICLAFCVECARCEGNATFSNLARIKSPGAHLAIEFGIDSAELFAAFPSRY